MVEYCGGERGIIPPHILHSSFPPSPPPDYSKLLMPMGKE
jgi:hypothetical protein